MNPESERKNSWVHGGSSSAQGRGSWVGVETKEVINGPQRERSSWEKEYLESGTEWLTGLGEAIGSKEE